MNEYSFRLWHHGGPKANETMALVATENPKRTATREKRRRQLIDATMTCIARKGMGSTTLGDVASEAGLSQGIVNLHFESKDNLLRETLRTLANEYRSRFDKTLASSGPGPAEKLHALMELDFRPSLCDRNKLAVWFAFWGETKSRPTYRKICNESDRYYDAVVESLCHEIFIDGNYSDRDATAIANALAAMTNGLWLSCLISPRYWSRKKAMHTVMHYLHTVFPNHFAAEQTSEY